MTNDKADSLVHIARRTKVFVRFITGSVNALSLVIFGAQVAGLKERDLSDFIAQNFLRGAPHVFCAWIFWAFLRTAACLCCAARLFAALRALQLISHEPGSQMGNPSVSGLRKQRSRPQLLASSSRWRLDLGATADQPFLEACEQKSLGMGYRTCRWPTFFSISSCLWWC